jgi:hypothetical protein
VEDAPPSGLSEQEQRRLLALTLLFRDNPDFAQAYADASLEEREEIDRQVAELGDRIMASN